MKRSVTTKSVNMKPWGIALLLVAATGCTAEPCTPGEPLRMASFNAGFARGDIDYVEERVTPVVNALAAEGLDVLCVQEFWLDWDALTSATNELPNTVRHPPIADCPVAACTRAEAQPLLDCTEAKCPNLFGTELTACGQTECPDEVNALSPGCIGCVVSNSDLGLDGIADACLVSDTGPGESYLYDCNYDTGILTNGEIVAQESRPMDSYLVAATVDFARIKTSSGELDVYCTHLASDMSFNYQGAFGDWKGEQAHQIDQLLAFVDEKSGDARPAVLLGDLNTGPAISSDNIGGEWPEHYDRLSAAGFDNPYSSQQDVSCTLCADNSFRSPDSSERLIDHVLFRNAPAAVTIQRFMTETVTLDIDNMPTESNPSDHYGLVAEVEGWCVE
jgi:endonuclease/exonuclease/phosphatase family metal-dependent hydrolase